MPNKSGCWPPHGSRPGAGQTIAIPPDAMRPAPPISMEFIPLSEKCRHPTRRCRRGQEERNATRHPLPTRTRRQSSMNRIERRASGVCPKGQREKNEPKTIGDYFGVGPSCPIPAKVGILGDAIHDCRCPHRGLHFSPIPKPMKAPINKPVGIDSSAQMRRRWRIMGAIPRFHPLTPLSG